AQAVPDRVRADRRPLRRRSRRVRPATRDNGTPEASGHFRGERASCDGRPDEPLNRSKEETMRKTLMAMTLASLAAGPILATPTFAQAQTSAQYSVTDTTVGKLIDDPAAAAVLQKLIPT